MAKYRTALGKILDMSVLIAKNEKTRAVGNMKVNARGDTIDSKGNVVKKATEKVTEKYNKTVGNRSAQPVRKNTPPPAKSGVNQRIDESQLTSSERELERELEDDLEVEKIKARENKNGK